MKSKEIKEKVHPKSFARIKIESDKINQKKLSMLNNFYELNYIKIY